MKKYLFTVLFCLSVCSAYCQVSTIEKYHKIDLLTVADKKLIPLLDGILTEESTRDYYRPDKKFAIFFHADSTIQIQAVDFLFSTAKTELEDFYGMVQYEGHPFFVAGAYLDERIFQRSEEKKRVKFYTNLAYKEKNGANVYLIGKEDGYSLWIYRYDGNDFKLLQFVNTSQPSD